MDFTLFLSMLTLSFAMSVSPGPVNILILTSSVNNGFLKTLSFISGATVGFTMLLVFIGFGFMSFLDDSVLFLKALSVFGAMFIFYMGYKVATSDTSIELESHNKKTLKFYEGFLLQWLNPKAWIASVSGIALYSSSHEVLYSFIFIYFVVCYLSLSFWGVVGSTTAKFFSSDSKVKIFNMIMGGLLMGSSLFLVFKA